MHGAGEEDGVCWGGDMNVNGFFKDMWQAVKYLLLTPGWGSKRRAEQRAYEEMLGEGVEKRALRL